MTSPPPSRTPESTTGASRIARPVFRSRAEVGDPTLAARVRVAVARCVQRHRPLENRHLKAAVPSVDARLYDRGAVPSADEFRRNIDPRITGIQRAAKVHSGDDGCREPTSCVLHNEALTHPSCTGTASSVPACIRHPGRRHRDCQACNHPRRKPLHPTLLPSPTAWRCPPTVRASGLNLPVTMS